MDEIKQQKIELIKDGRSNTKNKNGNDRLNTILSVIDRIYHFFENKFLSHKQPDELKLAKWVKLNKKSSDMVKDKVQNAKNSNFQTKPNRGRLINFDKSNKLL